MEQHKKEECNADMPGMTLANIAKACEGTYYGEQDKLQEKIAGAVIDSRLVERGYLFIPIRGERVDGHRFISEVFDKGALAVLSEEVLEQPAGPYILVDSCPKAMKKLAAFYRSQLDIKVVGITGSVGKTSTKEMIASVLSQKYDVLKTAGNFNNEIGLPLTIFQIRSHHQVAVLEMGISDFGEMERLAAMARPDICVITNIGLCHLENLKSRDGILKAKTACFSYMTGEGSAVLNGDDDKLRSVSEAGGKAPVFYGIGDKAGNIYAVDVQNFGFEGMQAAICTPMGNFAADIAIPGEHNVYNALAATGVGLQLGLTLEEIARGIAAGQTIAGRTNVIKVKGMTVIDDCYNANPVSMRAAIDLLARAGGRRVAVLGDMGELGEEEARLHYEVGSRVHEMGIDVLFCAGTLAREYVCGAGQTEVHYFPTRDAMVESLLSYVQAGDYILVKASHFMEFPKVVEALIK